MRDHAAAINLDWKKAMQYSIFSQAPATHVIGCLTQADLEHPAAPQPNS
jgi:hypothetical protein